MRRLPVIGTWFCWLAVPLEAHLAAMVFKVVKGIHVSTYCCNFQVLVYWSANAAFQPFGVGLFSLVWAVSGLLMWLNLGSYCG
ncbi:hypothetical protein U1Q18_013519 [Sarracenia purpurea var. burkii]